MWLQTCQSTSKGIDIKTFYSSCLCLTCLLTSPFTCRSSKSNSMFKPRGPLDFLGALACGSVSLLARAVEWSGNTADNLLVHSPLGWCLSAPLPQPLTTTECISLYPLCHVSLCEVPSKVLENQRGGCGSDIVCESEWFAFCRIQFLSAA